MPAYYILYDQAADIFYFEPAHNVLQKLLAKYQLEKFSQQFTVHFSNQLTSEAIKNIYQATLENGFLLRCLNAHLGTSADASTSPGIVIDNNKEITV